MLGSFLYKEVENLATTVKKIFLDFYINNIITVNAKQLDTESRIINVTCSDHGRKVSLDPSRMSAFVRLKKSDDNIVFNDASIKEDDGTIDILLTQQMLASEGRQKVDLVIVAMSNLSSYDFVEENGIYKLKNEDGTKVTVISTMSFYINVYKTAIDHDDVSSTSEFNTLLAGISNLEKAKSDIIKLGEILKETDESIKDAEELRADSENARITAEEVRVQEENARVIAEEGRVQAENARVVAEEGRVQAKNAIVNEFNIIKTEASEATTNANNAASAANEAAELCESVIDKTGVVLQQEKGVANGVAALDENAKILYDHLYTISDYNGILSDETADITGQELVCSNAIKEMNNYIKIKTDDLDININTLRLEMDSKLLLLPKIHYGTDIPNNSIGKDGDIYMQIIG